MQMGRLTQHRPNLVIVQGKGRLSSSCCGISTGVTAHRQNPHRPVQKTLHLLCTVSLASSPISCIAIGHINTSKCRVRLSEYSVSTVVTLVPDR